MPTNPLRKKREILSEIQQNQIVLFWLEHGGNLTNKELAERFDISVGIASRLTTKAIEVSKSHMRYNNLLNTIEGSGEENSLI